MRRLKHLAWTGLIVTTVILVIVACPPYLNDYEKEHHRTPKGSLLTFVRAGVSS